MGGYMGIYDSKTSDCIGFHYQYYTESSLLKNMSPYKWDECEGVAYYFSENGNLTHNTWYEDGESLVAICSSAHGTVVKGFE
jgi:hypothetical protein